MRRHGNQVAAMLLGQGHDVFRRLATSQKRLNHEPLGGQLSAALIQIGPVLANLGRVFQAQLFLIAGHESIGHVHQAQPGPGQPRQAANVLQDRFVGRRVFERNQNVLVHGNQSLL